MGERANARRRPADGLAPVPRRVPHQRPGPEGGKRDENRRRRTQALGAAALGLFLARGIESVTIDEIAQAAGAAKGSFYRYFEDKSDLVRALFEPVTARVDRAFDACDAALAAARSPADLEAAYAGLAGDLVPVLLEAPDVVKLYLQESRSPAVGARAPITDLADRIRAASVRITETAHAHGLLRALDPRITALVVVGAVESLLHQFLGGADLGSPDDVVQTLVALVLEGIRRP